MSMLSSTTPSIRASTFWSELPASEHLLQVYSNEDGFIAALESFVSGGLRQGDAAILAATAPHLHEVEKRLRAHWLDIDRARWEHRYIPLLAHEVLERFMVDDMPDDRLFEQTLDELLGKARGDGRRVRIFGEMVAELWADGNIAATIQLENLWGRACREKQVCLFCAYPRSAFEGHAPAAMRGLCGMHSLLIPG